MTELFLIPIAMAALLVWFHMQAVRELALRAAKRHCRDMGVQFLDGSVVFEGVKLARGRSGAVALAQRFRFEFTTTGEKRYRGETVFVGRRQVSMQLEPHALVAEGDDRITPP